MDHAYAIHVLKLPDSFTPNELRTNYKRMALLLHPDRRTLDTLSANQLFGILTESYKFLKGEGNTKANIDPDWLTLRSQADHRGGAQDNHDATGMGTSFNIDGFNANFSDTRLGDENDRGYSSWMQRLSPDAAAVKQKRRQEEDRTKAAASNSSLAMREPEALPSSTSVPHSELGVGRVKDFGRPVDVVGKRVNLGYTDYKVAHMSASCLIDPEIVQTRHQFSTIEEFERARSLCSSTTMTPQEQATISRNQAILDTREDRRLASLRSRDDIVSKHHAKHTNLLK